ncbi:MAG: hypothetical protein R6X19_00140 [Kiritimatiellia bacterium]
MNLEIRSIKDAGSLTHERLVLKVLKDCDIGHYFVFKSIYMDDNNISTAIDQPFWFPDLSVKTGDLVVVYSKRGIQSQVANKNGLTTHFLYRGLDQAIWNNARECAVVFEIADWVAKRNNANQE